MVTTENVRKALTDLTPLYAVAGAVDLAAEKLREVPPLLEKLGDEAPERINKVRATDPKAVQERVARQAKEVQAKLTERLGAVELDLKRLSDTAQDFALRQVGRAAETAVKAGETYNELVDRGRGAVRTWRGEAAEQTEELAVAIEPEPEHKPETEERPAARKPAAKKTTPRKTTQGKPGE
ncbi:hypothetical protein ACFOSC_19760 [Streptantibioticus rubrisoli]|uniref:Heparin binding hemagglutinin HbhA n=1 Tax=Streptantibioticus rubrisoli TaxID=1387313 RepID=A0ABT1PK55_9ACTN|nr:hypothetical protein [Streptantibioticus rubrisoli]MCQ4045740.1 hypothetical protein [Streptantibioticus rubrisoli]